MFELQAPSIPIITIQETNFSGVVEKNHTGIGYEFDDPEALTRILIAIAEAPEIITNMKQNRLGRTELFTSQLVLFLP